MAASSIWSRVRSSGRGVPHLTLPLTARDALHSFRTRSSTSSSLAGEADSRPLLAPTPRPRRLRRPRTAFQLASPPPPHPVDRLRLRLRATGRVHRAVNTSIRSRTVTPSISQEEVVTSPRATLLHRPARPLPLPAVRSRRPPTRAPRPTTVTRVPKSCLQVLLLLRERTTSHRRRQERPPSASRRPTTRHPWASTQKNRHSKRVNLNTLPRSQVSN